MNFEPFLIHCVTQKKCSSNTVIAYRSDLKMFSDFMKSEGLSRTAEVDFKTIDRYIEYLKNRPNPRFGRIGTAESSIARRLAAVSQYLNYVQVSEDPGQKNPLRGLTRRWKKDNKPKPVSDPVLDKLLDGVTVLRDRVLMALFIATGLRVSEMRQLNRDSITMSVHRDEKGLERVTGTRRGSGKRFKAAPVLRRRGDSRNLCRIRQWAKGFQSSSVRIATTATDVRTKHTEHTLEVVQST
jgi:site-specific recombinase XerD